MSSSWKDAWAEKIWQHVKSDFDSLSKDGTSSAGIGSQYRTDTLLEKLQKHSEARNIAINLAWVTINPEDYADFTWLKLERLSSQLFPQDRIPTVWPKGHNVQLVAHSLVEAPTKGSWKPFALSQVVLAYWHAVSVAKIAGKPEAVAALHKLCRGAVADFKYFATLNPTELMLAEANVGETNEQLREFFGNQGIALVRLVQRVRKSLLSDRSKVTGEAIAQYLQEKIRWGHVPWYSLLIFRFHFQTLIGRRSPMILRQSGFLQQTHVARCSRSARCWRNAREKQSD